MKNHRFCRPLLEMLEDRRTPAGTVTGSFANGTWTLVGDAEANDIRINPTAIANQFEVSGLNGTAVAGVVNASNVRNIVVRLKAGDDLVEVNQTGAFARLLGNLTVIGGNGANKVDIDHFQMQNLTVSNGSNASGSDFVYVADSMVRKGVAINNGNGDSEIQFYRDGSDVSSIGGSVTVSNGVGRDYSYFTDTCIGGNVTITNGLPDASDDAGYVIINNHDNDTSRSIIGGNVTVRYRDGFVDYDSIRDAEVLGNVRFSYGSADSKLYIDNYEVNQPTHIHGNFTVIGRGNTLVDIGLQYGQQGLIVGKNFTVLTGGANDDIDIHRLSVGGATRIVTGDSNDGIVIDDSSFAGPTTILTGGGNDSVLIETVFAYPDATQFAKSLQVIMGADNDTLTTGASNQNGRRVELLGRAVLAGGAGVDTFNRLNLDAVFASAINNSFETINR